MSVSSVNPYAQTYAAYGTKTDNGAEQKGQQVEREEEAAAVYVKSEPEVAASKTYKKNPELVSRMKLDLEQHQNQLREMVVKMLSKQGLTAKDALSGVVFNVDEETRLAAEKEIGEDGYWGVKETTKRTVDFAKALTGGDPSKVGAMRDAIVKGFELAEKAWGGKLPDICQQTREAIMKELDAWEKGE